MKTYTNPKCKEIHTIETNDKTYFIGREIATGLNYFDISGAIQKYVSFSNKFTKTLDIPGQKGRRILIDTTGVKSLINHMPYHTPLFSGI